MLLRYTEVGATAAALSAAGRGDEADRSSKRMRMEAEQRVALGGKMDDDFHMYGDDDTVAAAGSAARLAFQFERCDTIINIGPIGSSCAVG